MLEIIHLDTIKQEIESYKRDVEEVVQFAKDLDIKSREDVKKSIDYVAKARTIRDSINEKKDELSTDAKSYLKKINNLSKDFTEPLEQVEDILVQKIDTWRKRDNLITLEEDDFLAFPCIETKTRSELATLTVLNSHRFELQDANLVPREYMTVDEKKINLALKNGIRTIPGIEIIEETKTIIRRK